MLIIVNVVPQDLVKAEEIMMNFSVKNDPEIQLLLGLIKKKNGDYKKAIEFFKIASRSGNGESHYELGKMLYKKLGCSSNKPKAMKFLAMAKKN